MTSMARLDPLEQGYYSILNLSYTASSDDIHEAFQSKIKLVQLDDHVDRKNTFQMITTAHQVLSNKDSRSGYDRVLLLRYYIHQQCDFSSQIIHPHLVFSLHKINERGAQQPRIFKFDFVKQEFSNWRKDELRTSFTFRDLKSMEDVPFKPNELVIHFHEYPRPYHLSASSVRIKETLCKLFSGILQHRLRIVMDDMTLPSKSDHKGFVQKRGNSGLQYAQRYAVLGSSNLLLFRKPECRDLVSVIHMNKSEVEISQQFDPHEFTLTTPHTQYKLRCDDIDDAKMWVKTLRAELADQQHEQQKMQRHRKQTSCVPFVRLSFPLTDSDLPVVEESVTREIVEDDQPKLSTEEMNGELDELNKKIDEMSVALEEMKNRRSELLAKLGKAPSNVLKRTARKIGEFFRSTSHTEMI